MRQEQLERLIESAERGDASSRKRLFTVHYDGLHRPTQRELCRNTFLTMSSATRLHETCLNLARRQGVPDRAGLTGVA